jgi:acylphosphatase
VIERKRFEAVVHGRVQGVGFRWWVRNRAALLNLQGWVANEPSGSVRVVAEGDAPALQQLAAELRDGPSGAFVERVETSFGAATGEFRRFDIRAAGHSGD